MKAKVPPKKLPSYLKYALLGAAVVALFPSEAMALTKTGTIGDVFEKVMALINSEVYPVLCVGGASYGAYHSFKNQALGPAGVAAGAIAFMSLLKGWVGTSFTLTIGG